MQRVRENRILCDTNELRRTVLMPDADWAENMIEPETPYKLDDALRSLDAFNAPTFQFRIPPSLRHAPAARSTTATSTTAGTLTTVTTVTTGTWSVSAASLEFAHRIAVPSNIVWPHPDDDECDT